jgi:1-deoxy-D-xylulose-5-phosphate synthase
MSVLDKINFPEDLKKLDIEELNALSEDIRKMIIDTVSVTGGHLASALGVIELTIALHYTFDTPKDKIIFDVGHQSYAHKLLTGRKELFKSLRTLNGLNGFTRASESIYDCFVSGHSSTSLSIADGFMRARTLDKENYEIVSVIGDGALTGGMTHEALNDLGTINGKQIIIINDNTMSISKSIGSMADYLANMHTRRWYVRLKNSLKRRLGKTNVKKEKKILFLRTLKNSVKYLLQGALPFDQYGVKYFGPVDGHNIHQLLKYLNLAKNYNNSSIIHVVTVKGNGCAEAVEDPDRYHGLCSPEEKCNGESFSAAAGKTLEAMAALDNKIVAVTAAMSSGTGLTGFSESYPERFYDVGIAEGHAVTMCAAMASRGYRPYFAVYSTFLQRGFDQLIHDVCIEKRNVTLLVDRSGIVGRDGETHQGTMDISYLSLMPNMTIASPADIEDLKSLIKWSGDFKGPLAIRYPKGSIKLEFKRTPVEYGKWSMLRVGGSKVIVITAGSDVALNAFNAAEGTGASVINARFIKPLDSQMLDSLVGKTVIVAEDNVINGGLYSAIASYYALKRSKVELISLSVGDRFVPQGGREELYAINRLDEEGIRSVINLCV